MIRITSFGTYLVKDVSCGLLELGGVREGLEELVLAPALLLGCPVNLLEDVGVIPIRHGRADACTGSLKIIVPQGRIGSHSAGCPGILRRGLECSPIGRLDVCLRGAASLEDLGVAVSGVDALLHGRDTTDLVDSGPGRGAFANFNQINLLCSLRFDAAVY